MSTEIDEYSSTMEVIFILFVKKNGGKCVLLRRGNPTLSNSNELCADNTTSERQIWAGLKHLKTMYLNDCLIYEHLWCVLFILAQQHENKVKTWIVISVSVIKCCLCTFLNSDTMLNCHTIAIIICDDLVQSHTLSSNVFIKSRIGIWLDCGWLLMPSWAKDKDFSLLGVVESLS